MKINIEIDFAINDSSLPTEVEIKEWVEQVFVHLQRSAEIGIKIIDKDESQLLNKTYRHKDKPTNVLSFPYEMSANLEEPIIGDLAICAPIVIEEACNQHKSIPMHFAHLVIHGCLHLQGFDHENDDEANIMEALEIKLMKMIGFANPYETNIIEGAK